MAQRRPKRGRPVKEGALRREPKIPFIPGPVHGPILDKLAAERTGGNKNALLRLLLEEAEKTGKGSTRLVSGSRRGAVSRFRRTAAQGVRGLRAAA